MNANPSDLPLELVGAAVLDRLAGFATIGLGSRKCRWRYHPLIQKTIREQLRHTPENVTRNRKPLERPAPYGAIWELRFGPRNRLRVFYTVDAVEQTVSVLAVGLKEGNRLFIGGEEVEP